MTRKFLQVLVRFFSSTVINYQCVNPFFWHMYFYCRWSFELKTFNWLLKGMFFRKKEGKNSIIFHSYNCHTIPLLTPICQYMIYHSSFVKFFWEIVIKGYKVVFGHNKSLWQMVKFSITLHSFEKTYNIKHVFQHHLILHEVSCFCKMHITIRLQMCPWQQGKIHPCSHNVNCIFLSSFRKTGLLFFCVKMSSFSSKTF